MSNIFKEWFNNWRKENKMSTSSIPFGAPVAAARTATTVAPAATSTPTPAATAPPANAVNITLVYEGKKLIARTFDLDAVINKIEETKVGHELATLLQAAANFALLHGDSFPDTHVIDITPENVETVLDPPKK